MSAKYYVFATLQTPQGEIDDASGEFPSVEELLVFLNAQKGYFIDLKVIHGQAVELEEIPRKFKLKQ